VRAREGVDGFQDGVERGRTFGAVEEESLFTVFARFGFALFEDAGGARVAGFAGGWVRFGLGKGIGRGSRVGYERESWLAYTSRSMADVLLFGCWRWEVADCDLCSFKIDTELSQLFFGTLAGSR